MFWFLYPKLLCISIVLFHFLIKLPFKSYCHTSLFKDYFLSETYTRHINTESLDGLNGEFAVSFGLLMQAIWNSSHRIIAPRRFKSSLVELKPQFQGFIQHDAQELLSCILDVFIEL